MADEIEKGIAAAAAAKAPSARVEENAPVETAEV